MPSGSTYGPFVFVSHAKADKKDAPLLKGVVQRLLGAGIAVFIDDPDAFPDFRDQARGCLRLRGGGKWDDQIDHLLGEASCVLICVTPNLVRRFRDDRSQIIAKEIAAASHLKRAVVTRLAATDWADMPDWIHREQIVDLVETPQKIDDLVEDVRRTLDRVNRERIGPAKEAPAAPKWRHPFAPFLVDRGAQEKDVANYLRGRATAQDAWQTAFVVKGPRNECLDHFLQRLREHTSPQYLPDRQSWHQELVDWPVEASDLEHFKQQYSLKLESRPPETGGQSIRETLQTSSKPVAIVSFLRFEDWHARQADLIFHWLQYWKQQAMTAPRMKAVPIFCLELPPLEPGWSTPPALRERGGICARKIWKQLEQVEKRADREPSMFNLRRLDMLTPVRPRDADDWRRDQIKDAASSEWQELGRHFDKLFSGRAKKHGIAMQDWGDQIGSVLTPAHSAKGPD